MTGPKDAEVILLQPEKSRDSLIETKSLDAMDELQLRALLAEHSQEHKLLDLRLTDVQQRSERDMLEIARLKKQKLHVKDKIQAIKAKILPDIIA